MISMPDPQGNTLHVGELEEFLDLTRPLWLFNSGAWAQGTGALGIGATPTGFEPVFMA
jgi:hypothetical protein